MIADGLTKVLCVAKWSSFLQQLGLSTNYIPSSRQELLMKQLQEHLEWKD
jgi:hypothetical protein